MPSLLATTQSALDGGRILEHCNSRSLRLTRYALPDLKEDVRKGYLQRALDSERHDQSTTAYLAWAKTLPSAVHLHARLEARLLLNMAGSVIENAGLLLDRYGIAYIPGSAVKACARRAALATLRQWCETGVKPSAADDALALAAAPFTTPGDLLLAIIRIFGCTDLEWQDWNADKNDGNDLAWACGEQWENLNLTARAQLPSDALRGSVAFLPAYPDPAKLPNADLELDVLTSHHPDYYGEKRDRQGKLIQPTATDTENPNPVYFPAVAAGAIYTFALLPVHATSADSPLLTYAKIWLTTGLTVLGLGAKTAAGYGYFSDYTTTINDELKAQQATAKIAEARATLAPDPALIADFKTKKPDQLRGLINAYAVDAKFWTNKDERFQLTLLHFATQEDRALYDAEKANPKSKIIAGLRNLTAKFNRTIPE